jgi:rhodanese-related sulfurtransferase
VAGRRVHDLRRLDPEALCAPDLERSTLPEGAVVLDLRPRDAFASWHPPDAVRLDFAEALRAYPSFARDRRYLLVCEFGLKSAHLAELMRKEGLEAWSFHGGTRALRRALERGTARA